MPSPVALPLPTEPSRMANASIHGQGTRVAYVLAHPANRYSDHFLLEPLAATGATAIGVDTRFVDDARSLCFAHAVADVGAAVAHARSVADRVVLVGHSGGGPLMALYQSWAENGAPTTTPCKRPTELTAARLPPADALVLIAAHPSRAAILQGWIDPSIRNESDPSDRDPDLELYTRVAPLDRAWVQHYRDAQVRRLERIERWALHTLSNLTPTDDPSFTIWRTFADPRFVDGTLDPNDRRLGMTPFGPPEGVNRSPKGLARHHTVRGFIDQWGPSTTSADGPARLAETRVPVRSIELGADSIVFPSQLASWNVDDTVRLAGVRHNPRGDASGIRAILDAMP